ncbi:hypothetical protein SAMN05216378_4327 [Paenibacillus catalpae]|uniref:Uncharacterized protein n=1 Tax=Paenibacillus catalpae TaxID=1045775 RepID=A0A1I2DXW9_9BACL|nr:hypothetical protein [Paenibacillus catalpae]SFE85083.1 hypothetical protein SAMN05216378_4327 [Paenibacillus catalpae]
MNKKSRALITLAATALLVPALIVNASSAAAASKAPTAAVKSSFFSQSPFANSFIQKVIQNFAQEVQKAADSIQNGKGNNGNGNGNSGNNGNGNGNSGNNGNGNGNSGNNGNGNGNTGNNGNGNGNSGNNGNGNGNTDNNGNGNGNSGNNGNGNGNSGNNGNGNGNSGNNGNNEKKIQQVYNNTSAKLFQLRNQCQAGLTDIAVQFTTLTSTHEKTELYKTGTAAFDSCTNQYKTIMDDAAAQIVALGGEPSILEPMQTRYEEEIIAGRAQLNAIVNK